MEVSMAVEEGEEICTVPVGGVGYPGKYHARRTKKGEVLGALGGKTGGGRCGLLSAGLRGASAGYGCGEMEGGKTVRHTAQMTWRSRAQ